MAQRTSARAATVAVLVCSSMLLAACGSSRPAGSAPGTTGHPDAAGTVWLCRPGTTPDPCAGSLDTTVVPASGGRTVTQLAPVATTTFDCFYVYPTVSTQPTDNSNLKIQAAEVGVAVDQASPFSQVCRVWAPMYRQRTEISLLSGLGSDPGADSVAFTSLLSGWTDYIDHFNDGRPVIFIGHSQGAAMLIRLLARAIDSSPALRARMVTAIIAGGNVTVPTGKVVGASFTHIPLCTSVGEIGCVIAYSTFPTEPPPDALFGRPGQGVSLQSGQTNATGVQVACVNPAAIAGGTASLAPMFLEASFPPPAPSVSTRWVSYPGLYTASCMSAGGASWLQVTDVAARGDVRPVVTESLGPQWGYHVEDVNLVLGNLVNDVRAQEAAYMRLHP